MNYNVRQNNATRVIIMRYRLIVFFALFTNIKPTMINPDAKAISVFLMGILKVDLLYTPINTKIHTQGQKQ